MTPNSKIVLLGVGQTARAFVRALEADRRDGDKREHKASDNIWATTRGAVASREDKNSGIKFVSLAAEPDLKSLCEAACVLVSFPPDGESDERLCQQIKDVARRIVYISSTGVYGGISGVIDNYTKPPAAVDERTFRRLAAEKIWLNAGAIVLRAPGLYGPDGGMHKRIAAGTYKLPGDGTNFVSRIHLDDLGRMIVAAFDSDRLQSRTFVVGDLKPSTQLEVAQWLCARLNLPLPQSVPLEEVDVTLRGNRQVDSRETLDILGVKLIYPSYVEGFEQCLKAL